MGNQIKVNFSLGKTANMAFPIDEGSKGVLFGESRRDEDNTEDCTLGLMYKTVNTETDEIIDGPMTIGEYKPRSEKIRKSEVDESEMSRYIKSRFRDITTGVRALGDGNGHDKHDYMVAKAEEFNVSAPDPTVINENIKQKENINESSESFDSDDLSENLEPVGIGSNINEE